MARRERDRFGRGDGDEQRRDARGARPAPQGKPAPQGPRPAPQGPRPGDRRPPQAPPRPLTVAEDPNAYRSPGFQDVDQNPYKIDYAGLPKDVEEEEAEGAAATESPAPQAPRRDPSLPRGMLGRNADRKGTDPNAYRSPAPQAPRRDPSLPRGMLGRNADRKGTDPNAYRSPAFKDLDRVHQRFGARRRSGDNRPRAPEFPEGAPKEEPEVEAQPDAAPEPEPKG